MPRLVSDPKRDIGSRLYFQGRGTSYKLAVSKQQMISIPSNFLIFESDGNEVMFHCAIPKVPRQVLAIIANECRDRLLQFVFDSHSLEGGGSRYNRLTIWSKDEIIDLERIKIPLSLHPASLVLLVSRVRSLISYDVHRR